MNRRLLVWSALMLFALIAMFAGMERSAIAQDDVTPQTATPMPSPTNNGGNAKWTVDSDTFESHYPKGFTITLNASSSAGKIVTATVFWRPSPGYINRIPGKVNDDGTITAEWIPASDTMPAWIGINYWWDLVDEAGNNFQTPYADAEYADNSRKWNRAESVDVEVIWENGVPNSIGTETIKAMATQRAFYLRNWGFLLNYRPRVIIYASLTSYSEWDEGNAVSVNGIYYVGTTRAEWGATVQRYLPQRGASYVAWNIVLHEIGHLYQQAAGAFVQGVDWFIEGNAKYFELREHCVDYSKTLARRNALPTLQGDGPNIRGGNVDGYFVGCAFFYWLADTYGPDAHRELWSLITKGTSRVDALQKITGLSFADMDTAFRKWLGLRNPVAPTPMEFPTLEFPPTRAPKKP